MRQKTPWTQQRPRMRDELHVAAALDLVIKTITEHLWASGLILSYSGALMPDVVVITI